MRDGLARQGRQGRHNLGSQMGAQAKPLTLQRELAEGKVSPLEAAGPQVVQHLATQAATHLLRAPHAEYLALSIGETANYPDCRGPRVDTLHLHLHLHLHLNRLRHKKDGEVSPA